MHEPLNPEVAILNEALELPAGERQEYLARSCRGNEALRRQIEALLLAHDQAADFLDQPSVQRTQTTADHTRLAIAFPFEKPGDRIGRYKLIEQIGEGGCGLVYLAEQKESVRRQVALKVIKLGMDTKSVIARFEAERQALAMMDHPNIAKVFDAGATETGRPYFVMELVRGVKITEFCDNKGLSIKQRLHLFIQVCQAIQHAHQKGVIHRDIKPSNILVSAADDPAAPGVPKVIDFGIAKATLQKLTDKTVITQLAAFIGTPAYMSPEQAEMTSLDIDTCSDIYSLGVLLYELLTGRTPFDQKQLLGAGLDELRRTIREVAPVKPSTRLKQLRAADDVRRGSFVQSEPAASSPRRLQELIHALRGDLDWIVMKCLEKDRARRYETANGLARDIERHLRNEPVTARPPSALDRFQKLVRRNKLAVTGIGALATALVIVATGSTVAAWRVAGARRAEQGERQKAETANRDLRQTVNLLELERVEEFFTAHDSAAGLAHLGAMLRRDPSNAIAATRLVSALQHRPWALPVGPPLRHADRVNRVAFSPDGQRVLSASWDSTVRVWDAVTGQALVTVQHGGKVTSAQFSSAGDRILTASVSGSACIWDAATGEARTPRLRHEGPIEWAEFSPDDRKVVTAGADKVARVWDAGTGALERELRAHNSPVVIARFSPDGKRIVTGGWSGSIRLWNVDTGETLLRVEDRKAQLTALAFSPDGSRLLVVCEDGIVRLWNAHTGESAGEPLAHDKPVWHAAFSPDGKWLLTACEDGAARLWDSRTTRQHAEPLRHESGVSFGVFSPDTRSVITMSSDGTARVWDVATGWPVCQPLRQLARILHADFSPDGRRIVTGSYDGAAQVWVRREPLEPGTAIRHQGFALPLAFNADGSAVLVAGGDRTVVLWDARTGRALIEPVRPDSFPNCGDIAPDGRCLVLGCSDGALRVWDFGETNSTDGTMTMKPRVFAGPQKNDRRLRTVRFSRDGARLVTASEDGQARVWAAGDGRPITEPLVHGGVVVMAQFSPDNRWVVTASEDETARVWDAQTGQPVTAPLAHHDHVKWAEFSPENARVLTASTDDTARIWDARTGQGLTPPLQHARSVVRAAFSPEGLRVATASLDRTVQLWDATTGRALTPPLRHDGQVGWVLFSADGQRIMTACGSSQARFWDASTGRPLTEWLKVESYWGARLNAAAERIAMGSKDGMLRVWGLPRAPTPVPGWFPEFVEAVAGISLTEQGAMELVPAGRLQAFAKQIPLGATGDEYEQLARDFLEAGPKP